MTPSEKEQSIREGDRGVCAMCGGSLVRGTADLPFVRGEHVLVVRGVPAEVCGDCGEAYLEGPPLDRTLSMVRALEAAEAEFSVVRYRAA